MILERCPAPAKLNLFLHVVGRRPDGYHELETLFELIDWCDYITLERRTDGEIHRPMGSEQIPADQDLVVKAARLLQQRTGTHFGVDISVEKHLPMGAGLGGGSSDAATTMLGLNRLWGLGLSRTTLQTWALELGADVPFFIFGRPAFAHGVGEQLTSTPMPACCYDVVVPQVSVATESIFKSPDLTRNTKSIRVANFPAAQTHLSFETSGLSSMSGSETSEDIQWMWREWKNDLQAVTTTLFPDVAVCLDQLNQRWPGGHARMSGSGSACFAQIDSEPSGCSQPEKAANACGRVVRNLAQHPLFAWACSD